MMSDRVSKFQKERDENSCNMVIASCMCVLNKTRRQMKFMRCSYLALHVENFLIFCSKVYRQICVINSPNVY